jgi:hypothetical protein
MLQYRLDIRLVDTYLSWLRYTRVNVLTDHCCVRNAWARGNCTCMLMYVKACVCVCVCVWMCICVNVYLWASEQSTLQASCLDNTSTARFWVADWVECAAIMKTIMRLTTRAFYDHRTQFCRQFIPNFFRLAAESHSKSGLGFPQGKVFIG